MTRSMKLVYEAIKSGQRNGNLITVTYKEIARETGLQITMVSSCIRLLVRDSYIERINNFSESGGARTNSYKIRKSIEV